MATLVGGNLLLVAALVAADSIGSYLFTPPGETHPWLWLMPGIALAALVWNRLRTWPALLVAPLLLPGHEAVGLEVRASAIALLVLPPLAGALMLQISGFELSFRRRNDALVFVGLGVVVPHLLYIAAMELTALIAGGGGPDATTLLTDSLRSAISLLAVGAAALAWRSRGQPRSASALESVLLMSASLLFAWLLCRSHVEMNAADNHLELALIALVLWATLRLGMLPASNLALAIGGVSAFYGARGMGPFANGAHEPWGMFTFLGVATLSVLLVHSLESERRAAELQGYRSRSLMKKVLDEVPALINVKNREGRTIFINREHEKYLDRPLEEALGKTVLNLLEGPAAEQLFEQDLEVLGTGRPIPYHELEVELPRAGPRTFLATKIPLFEESADEATPSGVITVEVDVTERRRAEREARHLEEQVQRLAQLESLGVLAGGIAHDFNNLLTSVLGYTNLAAARLRDDAETQDLLRRVEKAAMRASELCEQMLAYAGKGKVSVIAIDLSHLAAELADLLRAAIDPRAQLVLDLAPKLPAVKADPTQVRQVLSNLITNASDALDGEPGTVRLSTSVIELTSRRLRELELGARLAPGRYVQVAVSDDGMGIPPERLGRIFEPFFTTKASGRGLGLAAVHGMIRSHGGAIAVQSEPGRGATFRVFLPVAEDVVAQPTPIPATRIQVTRGRILVVDDEEPVRELAREVLGKAGFGVECAENGPRALELLATVEVGFFDGVLLDLKMPLMAGDEVFRRIHDRFPDLPVVMTSGYSQGEVGSYPGSKEWAGFLKKPFHPNDLLAIVSRCLRTARQAAARGAV